MVQVICMTCQIILLFSYNHIVTAFNIASNGATRIPVPPKGKGSFFGFTTLMMPQSTSADQRLLIGAPQFDFVKDERSGGYTICSSISSNPSCGAQQYAGANLNFVNDSYNEGFASVVAMLEDGTLLVCGPRWKDTSLVQRRSFKFMPGRCSVNKNTNSWNDIRPFFHVRTRDKQSYYITNNIYNHGFASFGFAVDSDKRSVFIIGAPGVLNFEGTIVAYDVLSGNTTTLDNTKDNTAYGYQGYSVKIGNFCPGYDVCFATGAPNAKQIGKVFLYRWRNKETIEHIDDIEGDQTWSWFGYALGVGDVDKDSLDELLVGAPHYGDPKDIENGLDQGRVYVYSKKTVAEKFKLSVVLDGSRSKFGRFGSAIQNIGDINMDTYTDFVVGAPGEDEGKGCIYIFLGSSNGLISEATQRISAREMMPNTLNSFGFSFSDSATDSSRSFTMFTANSPASDTVFVLKSRPIVEVKLSLHTNPDVVVIEKGCDSLNMDVACFKIGFMMEVSIRGRSDCGVDPLLFAITFNLDADVKSVSWKRAAFVRGTDLHQSNITISSATCIHAEEHLATIIGAQVNLDRFTPMKILGTVEMFQKDGSVTEPILDALAPKSISTTVSFENNCGSNNKCELDLILSGNLGYKPKDQWSSIVINGTTELSVKLTIRNEGETSYWTVAKVTVDSPLFFKTVRSELPVSCDSLKDDSGDPPAVDKTEVLCNYYKPLDNRAELSVVLAFDTTDINLEHDKLTVTAEVQPYNSRQNVELKPDNNRQEMMTDVKIIADVSIHGSSSPTDVTLETANEISLTSQEDISNGYMVPDHEMKPMNVTHKYLVKNNGPSFLPSTTLEIYVPVIIADGTLLVHKENVMIAETDGKVSQCRSTVHFERVGNLKEAKITPKLTTTKKPTTKAPHQETTAPITTEPSIKEETTTEDEWIIIGPVNRKKRSADDEPGQVMDTIYTVSCSSNMQYCQVFVCDLTKGLQPGGHVEVNVSLVLDKANVPIPQDFASSYFMTTAKLIQPKHPLFEPWTRETRIETVTKFHRVYHGSGKINIWIIIGSIVAGLVLITVIVIILWRIGFFKRDKHMQVAQWKRESQRRSRISSNTSNKDKQ